jgi:hypothetical protein
MRIQRMFPIAIALLLLTGQVASAQMGKTSTPTYDAVKDFSTQSNPNGVWSYGYLTSWGAPLTLYTVADKSCYPGTSRWLEHADCSPPLVSHNDTGKTICDGSVCFPPWLLGLHPGGNGELAVVRWTAPSSGRFLIQVTFVGMDWAGPTSTYVYVLRNSKRLFLKAPINSYQWPLLLHPYGWTLSAGDTVDFIVDKGKDGDWHYDSTEVEVKVWNLGQKGERQ